MSSEDKYETLEKIGHGSFGVIRKVRRKADGFIMCRKEISYLRMSQKEREQLHAEFQILSTLRHPNIVAYYNREHLKVSQDLHLYMEYCGNGDLGRVIKDLTMKGQRAQESFVWSIFSQLVMALYRCHYGIDPPEVGANVLGLTQGTAAGPKVPAGTMTILHRDLKPENVFLGEDNSVKLGDFGLSKMIKSHDFASTYVGTPFYMSPEICAAEKYTLKSDIWSLGCIIYELCAREPPFNAKTHFQLVQKIKEGKFPALPDVYSPELGQVIKDCLRVNPDRRPDTASLLNLPVVRLMRKEKEVVDLNKSLKLREDALRKKEREVMERLAGLEMEKELIREELDSSLRREWEVKARLKIDHLVNAEIEQLHVRFEEEVQARVEEEVQARVEAELQKKTVAFVGSRPQSREDEHPTSPAKSDFKPDYPHSSVNTSGDEFPSTTDLTEYSIDSPESFRETKKTTRTPFARAQTMFVGNAANTPMDIEMGSPSPIAAIESLSLSPRRNGGTKAPTYNAGNIFTANIFANNANRSSGESRWDNPRGEPSLSDSEDDDIMPSPTRNIKSSKNPFTSKTRPVLTSQKSCPINRLKPAASNPGFVSKQIMPQAESGPRSPNRRLSKIPSAASLQPEASTAQGLTRTLSLNSNRKNADEAMGRMVAKNNMANIKGRTLVELQQARAGGRPMSAVVLPTTGENVSPKRAFRDRIGLERKSSGDEPVAVWDPDTMDGISLAASIIQIIDISSRVVAKGIDIYQSADGQLTEHGEIDHVTRALSSSARRIRKSIAANRPPYTDAEMEQLRLATDCRQIANELLKALERLKRRGRPGKWTSLRQGLKTVWNEDKIASLERRLDRYRQQMIESILETLRTQTEASAAQQSTIIQGIKNIQRRQDKLQEAQVDIGRQFFQEIRRHVGDADGERWRKDLLGAIHQKSSPRLRSLAQSAKRKKIRRWLIRSLEFKEMEDREIRITKASKETFKWIYEAPTANIRPWASFRAFLEQKDGGMYWITGKPGSGKSTLMKYLKHNNRTFDLLRQWAPEGVTVSAFYFWNSGIDMQMSVEGLLRTLLAKCLEQLPRNVAEQVFPGRWEALSLLGEDDTPWTWHELSLAVQKLVLSVCRDRKFFFLIDGLDEFSGDHAVLTDLILDLVSSAPNIKVCVASRPWVDFEDAFRSKPHLMLQDLTKRDIQQYIATTFQESPAFLDLEQRDPRHAKSLLSEIARKAEGVFLWVRLVVKSLLVGMANGDGIRELRERLERTPSNLEDMFKKMLASMESSYLEHASQLFQIHRASQGPLSLSIMAFADLEDQDEVLQRVLWPLTHSNLVARCRHMKRKLSSRCKGLLEIESLPMLGQQRDTDDGTDGNNNSLDVIMDCKVQYLHRTVKDFIEAPEIWGWIVATTKEQFDPCVALAKSHLLHLKSMDTTKLTCDEIWDRVVWCISYAKQSELNKGPVQTELMDELDRTATALTRHCQSFDLAEDYSSWGGEETHWTNHGIPAVGTSLAYLMAMCGMSGFLEARLSHDDDPELRHYGDNKTPLLFAVLEDYLVLSRYSAGKSIIISSPSKDTIRVLLQKGADPHQLHRGRSALTIAKAMASRGDRDFIEVLKILRECASLTPGRRKRPVRRTQSLGRKRASSASPGVPLTVENISRLDPSHETIPRADLIALNGSALESQSTFVPSEHSLGGPHWLHRLIQKASIFFHEWSINRG